MVNPRTVGWFADGRRFWILLLRQHRGPPPVGGDARLPAILIPVVLNVAQLEHFPEKHALGRDPGVDAGFPQENATKSF
jgi:hypothetical protein